MSENFEDNLLGGDFLRDSVPQIAYDTELCTLCGECALACPQDAISMQQQKPARG